MPKGGVDRARERNKEGVDTHRVHPELCWDEYSVPDSSYAMAYANTVSTHAQSVARKEMSTIPMALYLRLRTLLFVCCVRLEAVPGG